MQPMKLTDERIQEILDEVKQKILLNAPNSKTITLEKEINPVVKLEENDKVKITFAKEAWSKMWTLINACEKTECGWNMTVTKKSKKHFVITDILLYPQTVSGATVITDDEKYLNWANSLSDEVYNTNRFHGHSHVKMATSPSGPDMTYQEQILQNVNDFFIFGIFNQNKSIWLKIYDVKNNAVYGIDDIIITNQVEKYTDWAKEQIEEYIEEPVKSTYTSQYGQYGGYGGYNNQTGTYARPASAGDVHTFVQPNAIKTTEMTPWEKAKARQEAAEGTGTTAIATTTASATSTAPATPVADVILENEEALESPIITQAREDFSKLDTWAQCGFVSKKKFEDEIIALRKRGKTNAEVESEIEAYKEETLDKVLEVNMRDSASATWQSSIAAQ